MLVFQASYALLIFSPCRLRFKQWVSPKPEEGDDTALPDATSGRGGGFRPKKPARMIRGVLPGSNRRSSRVGITASEVDPHEIEEDVEQQGIGGVSRRRRHSSAGMTTTENHQPEEQQRTRQEDDDDDEDHTRSVEVDHPGIQIVVATTKV